MKAIFQLIVLPFILVFGISSIHSFEANAQRILEVNIEGDILLFELFDPEMSSPFFKGVSGPVIAGNPHNRLSVTGCNPYKTSVAGFFPLLKSGDCPLDQKVTNAIRAGAISLIVCFGEDEVLNFEDQRRLEVESGINIIFLDQAHCNTIKVALENDQSVEARIFKRSLGIVWGGPDEANSTFEGGLNDWTVAGANGNLWYHSIPIESSPVPGGWGASTGEPHFDYTLHPEINHFPRYYGVQTDRRITSESLDNGFAMLDADSWNNTDLGTHLENPIESELISPAIDLSGYEGRGLALRFTQSLRYCCNQNPNFKVKVSVDGFNTYLSFDPAAEISVNEINRSSVVQFPFYELLEGGVDLSNVQVKFVFDSESSHYFWMIDDVQIVELPDIHLIVDDAVFPLSAVCYPSGHGIQEELDFALTVTNEGGMNQEVVAVTVELREKEADRIIFSHTDMIQNLERGTSITHVFDDSYFLQKYHRDEFIINYRAEVPNSNHFDQYANNISYFFKVDFTPYSNEDCSRTKGFDGKFLSNTPDWYWGNAFYIRPSLSGSEFNGWFTGAEIALIEEELGDTQGNPTILVHLMRLNKSGKGAIEQLNTSLNVPPVYHPDFTSLAIAIIDPIELDGLKEGKVNSIPFNWFISVQPPQEFLHQPLEFKGDHYYFLFVHVSGDTPSLTPRYSIAYNPNNHQESRTAELVYIERSFDHEQGYRLFEKPYRNPVIRLAGDVFTNTESPFIIDKQDFYLYPIPAKDLLNLQFLEPIHGELTLELLDVSGKLVNRTVHNQVETGTITKNISDVKPGSYLLRIISGNEVRTQKVVIMR